MITGGGFRRPGLFWESTLWLARFDNVCVINLSPALGFDCLKPRSKRNISLKERNKGNFLNCLILKIIFPGYDF